MDEEQDEDCIDTDLSMLIITVRPSPLLELLTIRSQGTNYSGKSICLKQLALLTFMAHLGASPHSCTDLNGSEHLLQDRSSLLRPPSSD
jgi:hypothetical protein